MELAKAEKLAKELMTLHGLVAPKWTFNFDHSKRRFGVCKYNSLCGEIYRGSIGLSRALVLLNDEKDVRDVILHEIAHALTPGQHHNNVWKRKCIEIGAKPERCYSSKEVNVIPKETLKWQAVCGGCGKLHTKHRMTAKTLRCNIACRCQSGLHWDKKILLKYVDTKAV